MTTFLVWTADLGLGIGEMDDDHRAILAGINRVHEARAQGQAGPAVDRLVADLVGICAHHFADEEAYMAKIGYAGLGAHRQVHAQLLERLSTFAAEARAAGGKPTDAFFDFVRFWLISHIKGVDTKYAAHAKAA